MGDGAKDVLLVLLYRPRRHPTTRRNRCSVVVRGLYVCIHGDTKAVGRRTLCITLHTFVTVFFHVKPRQWVWMAAVSAIWMFMGGYIGIMYFAKHAKYGPLYAPTP